MLDGSMGPYFIAGLIALAFAGLVFAILFPYISGDREKDKRIQGVTENRARKMGAAAAAETQSSRKKSVADSLKEIDSRAKQKEKVTLRLQLQRAGLLVTPRDFYIASAISGLVCFGLAFFGLQAPLVGAAVAGFIGAMGLPRFVLNKMIKRRQAKFLNELANAIDVIVRGVKSGLPLNECIQVIARESPEPIAGEFREVVDQQRLGVTLGESLERMCDRLPLPEVRFLAIVVGIQQQAGGNLSEALGNLSGVLRDRLRMQLKIKGLSAEAKASAMVLASLPPGVMTMVYLTSPDYIMPLFSTTMGRFLVGIGACWMFTGVMVMKKMINFKY
ncbi:MAG: type II secretion system F family protein [Hyphomicrobium sp.]